MTSDLARVQDDVTLERVLTQRSSSVSEIAQQLTENIIQTTSTTSQQPVQYSHLKQQQQQQMSTDVNVSCDERQLQNEMTSGNHNVDVRSRREPNINIYNVQESNMCFDQQPAAVGQRIDLQPTSATGGVRQMADEDQPTERRVDIISGRWWDEPPPLPPPPPPSSPTGSISQQGRRRSRLICLTLSSRRRQRHRELKQQLDRLIEVQQRTAPAPATRTTAGGAAPSQVAEGGSSGRTMERDRGVAAGDELVERWQANLSRVSGRRLSFTIDNQEPLQSQSVPPTIICNIFFF